jgi:polysaccharide export outer membrane protein
MKKLFYYLFFCSVLFSCVPTKKSTYFQGEPQTKSELYKLNNEPYRLQVNDIIAIDIKAQNEENVALFKRSNLAGSGGDLYFTGYTVDRHGNIRIPYIGEVNVLGYTEKEVREKIEVELGKFLKKAESIFVTVKLEGIKFTVTGEVGGAGTKILNQNEVSIIDAISNSGEITEFGNRQEVTIIRNSLDGVKKYKIDLTSIDVFESENFYIQPNDIIYVPPLKRKSLGLGTTGLQSFTTLVSVLTFLSSTVLLIKNL